MPKVIGLQSLSGRLMRLSSAWFLGPIGWVSCLRARRIEMMPSRSVTLVEMVQSVESWLLWSSTLPAKLYISHPRLFSKPAWGPIVNIAAFLGNLNGNAARLIYAVGDFSL
jgi:hypothetical protein